MKDMCRGLALYGHGLVDSALLSWPRCTMNLWAGISWKEMRGSGASLPLSVQSAFGLDNGDHLTPGGATSGHLGGHLGGHSGGFPCLTCG